MLCSRPSIKDVSLPQCKDHSGSFSNDPLSPRIGCMGQVKRDNKIAGLPISQKLSITTKSNTISSISPIAKYSKLKKLFSGKNLTTTTTSSAALTAPSSCGSRQRVRVNSADVSRNRIKRCSKNDNVVPISIENMDPPLPVIKRVPKLEEENQVDNSLWKRRSGGAALKSLQLQQIHQPRPHLQLTSV
ncbi:hypothetical protein SESBI_02569 [Sesbania bispinosa]|nr:hypothetical protein SESBI_02569 [Sesbania bispinosa]